MFVQHRLARSSTHTLGNRKRQWLAFALHRRRRLCRCAVTFTQCAGCWGWGWVWVWGKGRQRFEVMALCGCIRDTPHFRVGRFRRQRRSWILGHGGRDAGWQRFECHHGRPRRGWRCWRHGKARHGRFGSIYRHWRAEEGHRWQGGFGHENGRVSCGHRPGHDNAPRDCGFASQVFHSPHRASLSRPPSARFSVSLERRVLTKNTQTSVFFTITAK